MCFLPDGEGGDAVVPSLDIGIIGEGELGGIGVGQIGGDGEIGESKLVIDEVGVVAEVLFKHLGGAVEFVVIAFDFFFVALSAAHGFHHQFDHEAKAGGGEAIGLPKLPARDIGAQLGIFGPKGIGFLGGEVLHDGVAFAKHEVSILEGGNLAEGIEGLEGGLALFAFEEIDDDHLDLKAEVLGDGDDATGIVRDGMNEELHHQRFSLVVVVRVQR